MMTRSPSAALVFSLALAVCSPAIAAEMTDGYIALMGGAQLWPDTSNQDELEASKRPGWMLGGAVGASTEVLGLTSRFELEAAHRVNRIHGRNGPGCTTGDCSADDLSGNELHATSVMVNAWPEFQWGDTSLYAGGGVGGAYVTALDDDLLTPVAQIGAGLIWRFSDAVEVDIGYRYFTTPPLELDRQDGRYHTHGAMVGLIWQFGQ